MCSERRLIRQAFRFELNPNLGQRMLLAKTVGASRFVFNWGLARSNRWYELTGMRPSRRELQTHLVALKKSDCPWLYEVSAHVGQAALKDLNDAFNRFFKGLSGEGPKSGFPRFKRKGERDSARLYEVTLEERHIRLPLIGRVRLKETRRERGFDGRILSATVSRRADRWFVSVAVEREREIAVSRRVQKPTDIVGVDLGLKAMAVVHDGSMTRFLEPHSALRKNLTKLRRLDRRLSRKQSGSANRRKAKVRRARLHYKICCQRRDYVHQFTSSLAKTKSVIVVEDLHVRGMQQNKHLALSISDAGMGELRRQLSYKSVWYGSTLIVADRFYPSSKICSGCGSVKDRLKLSERIFECDACGISLDRDENAAINLRGVGIAQLPEGLREVTPVEKKALASAAAEVKPASPKQEATADGTHRSTRRSASKGVLVQGLEAGSTISPRGRIPAAQR